jgi:hypothetical protein
VFLSGFREAFVWIATPNPGDKAILFHETPDLLVVHDNALPLKVHLNDPPAGFGALPLEHVLDQQVLLVVRLLPFSALGFTAQPAIITAATYTGDITEVTGAALQISCTEQFTDQCVLFGWFATTPSLSHRVFLGTHSPSRDT